MSHLSEAILHNSKAVILTLHDAYVAELLRDAADFFIIDAAARNFPVTVIQDIIRAARETPVLVRVENSTPSNLQHYLNLGVDGLILTDIHHAAEAEKAIAACLYPPEGIRPYRSLQPARNLSLQALNDQVTLIVEIATPQAASQIEEICEVTGINGVLVSPSRLAVAMEHMFDTDHSEVQACLRQIHVAAHGYELPFGIEGGGFDMEADFVLNIRDVDALIDGAGIASGDGLAQDDPYGFSTEKMLSGQSDDDDDADLSLQLVAQR